MERRTLVAAGLAAVAAAGVAETARAQTPEGTVGTERVEKPYQIRSGFVLIRAPDDVWLNPATVSTVAVTTTKGLPAFTIRADGVKYGIVGRAEDFLAACEAAEEIAWRAGRREP